MRVDKTTLYDLSVFHKEEEYSLFHKIDHTKTVAGRGVLLKNLHTPFNTLKDIQEVQEILSIIEKKIDAWPNRITNGTLLVIDKFLDDNPDTIPENANFFQALVYKWLHPADHSMIQFSVKQLFELIKGYEEIHAFFSEEKRPGKLANVLMHTEEILANRTLTLIKQKTHFEELNSAEILQCARFFHVEFCNKIRKLIELYGILDAWYSMAFANKKLKLQRPDFIDSNQPHISSKGLRHLMLQDPVSYNVELTEDKNFLFLTGANMAGKSTLIKGVGLATYLAHLGMNVPADEMKLTLFDGILTNINVEDNIVKGESYFFNEVQRIKQTVERINDGHKWLVLIDELFKGTNIQDAMKCSLAVIEGLIKMKNGLFILSTHLYEIGDELKKFKEIDFKYFETHLKDNELHFSYQLKDGISQDRMGFLILKKEGVIDLLEQLGK